MSSTTTTASIPSSYWSARRYAIAVALILALVIAAFSAGSRLTGSEPASTAAVEDDGGSDTSSRTTDDRVGAGVPRGGVQP